MSTFTLGRIEEVDLPFRGKSNFKLTDSVDGLPMPQIKTLGLNASF